MNTHSIRLSWDPPPVNLRNGVIIQYLIQQALVSKPDQIIDSLLNTSAEEVFTSGLSPDTTYSFVVTAITAGGPGPPSTAVIQRTYFLPPPFPLDRPVTIPGVSITDNTIPVALPLVDTTKFRYNNLLYM